MTRVSLTNSKRSTSGASGRSAERAIRASTWSRSPTSKTPVLSRFSASSTLLAIRSAKQISTPSCLLQARSLSPAASLSTLLAPTGARTPKMRSRASKSRSHASRWRICVIRTLTGARIRWVRCRHRRPASVRFPEITKYAHVPQSWRGLPNTTVEPWSWLVAPARPSLRSPSLASSWSEKAALRGFFSQSPRSHSSSRRWMIGLPRPMARLPRGQCVRIRRYR